ncbi:MULTISPECIES: LPS export ABC transporter periplasmic protein LptC [Desulfosediminicola]|uniref:LPS export ABC transporter periplasmic protein LptC n=1 Tax=Desulfosediminicola TaxID=2886823 RepID=UPI0010AD9302|nr:LPS export ABC transporter periplasmic protein LptC [Desulfosediminicola ganghwensis]
MIKRRNLIWLVPLALIFSFPAWKIPVGNFLTPRGGADSESIPGKEQSQNFNMEQVKIVQSKNGRITAEIRAVSAFTTEKTGEYMLDKVDADIFNESGDITNVVAKRGIFDGQSEVLTLMDDVVITKQKDDQNLYTDLFYYNDKDQTVHCPGPTRIEGEGIQVDGTSFDYDMAEGYYEMEGRVLCLIEGSISS